MPTNNKGFYKRSNLTPCDNFQNSDSIDSLRQTLKHKDYSGFVGACYNELTLLMNKQVPSPEDFVKMKEFLAVWEHEAKVKAPKPTKLFYMDKGPDNSYALRMDNKQVLGHFYINSSGYYTFHYAGMGGGYSAAATKEITSYLEELNQEQEMLFKEGSNEPI